MRFVMSLQEKPFNSIKEGKKDIEMRLNDEKRSQIHLGDIIEFSLNNSEEKLEVVVLDLSHYDSFKELYQDFDKVRLGYNQDEIGDYKDMEEYYSHEDIKKYGVVGIKILPLDKVTPALLTDHKICPTCFNKLNNNILYGNDEQTLFYKDELIECFFVGNPRSEGHVAISSRKHYKDMMDIEDELCKYIFVFAKKLMNIIKEVYKSESVYLCTMCDGPMNHFHLQLIPRYCYEKRGSTNFVKERKEYIFDKEKFEKVKELLKK